jgi:mitochondrial fission protein ELM1
LAAFEPDCLPDAQLYYKVGLSVQTAANSRHGDGPVAWGLHDGRVGIRNQVMGLAEAIGFPVAEKHLDVRFPWSHLAPPLWLAPLRAGGSACDRLEPPWPDLLVTCGRLGVAPAVAVKRASGGRSFLVHVQDPVFHRRRFDAIVAPEHDQVRGANVLTSRGAVHHVTPAKLADAALRLGPRFASLPHPLVAVLIGGTNKVFRFTLDGLATLADQLAALCRSDGVGLLVTPSRRTGAEGERVLRDRLAGLPAYLWDGTGENPYFAFLALADAIIVTADSVSMVSEAGSTGKPVHVVELDGGSAKFRRFHAVMREAGVTRPFAGRLERWSYAPLNDTARIAAEIRARLDRSTARRAA